MSEEKLSSKKLDIEGAQRSSAGEEKLKETYNKIPEDIGLSHVTGDTVKNSNMVRENGDTALDGADEKMLGSDEKEVLALKNIEVKFIPAGDHKNGDAKIDIGGAEKTFTGMTKEELMKYANDPFWVKLRWVLFILFWAMWVAMLAGAIAIIVYAPKCAAPTPLVWWKKGPLVQITGDEDPAQINEIKTFSAKGVIYELSGDETYRVDTPEVENKIKQLVEKYKANDVHVVLDLTANYVTKEDKLFIRASTLGQQEDLSAFVTSDRAYNWKKAVGNGSAWKNEGKKFFLSQFGDNYDLQMTSPAAQEKLIGVLTHLASLGVKGFRLRNAKHFIVSSDLGDELPNKNVNGKDSESYEFFSHSKSTYQEGLGDILRNISKAVHSATDGEGFLTIADDSATHAYRLVATNSTLFGFDLPYFKFLNLFLESSGDKVPKELHSGFSSLKETQTVDISTLWMQINYSSVNFDHLDKSAYNIFLSLLPGVQVMPFSAIEYADNHTEMYKKLNEARESPVFQHGNFEYLLSANETAFAYTRIKAGNPGYFVAINPTDVDIKANFASDVVGSEMSVFLLSDGFGDEPAKGKVSTNAVPLAKHSVAIFSFVPK